MLTGKPRLQRQVEKFENDLGNRNWTLVATNAEHFELSKGEEVQAAASYLNIRFGINQFLTHYLRTRLRHLTHHPKWTTDSIFDEEGPALVAWMRPHLMMHFKVELDFFKRLKLQQVLGQVEEDAPDFMSLLSDCFKVCSLQQMIEHHPKETVKGINTMLQLYRSLCIQSSIDGDPEELFKFLEELGLANSSGWTTTKHNLFAVTY